MPLKILSAVMLIYTVIASKFCRLFFYSYLNHPSKTYVKMATVARKVNISLTDTKNGMFIAFKSNIHCHNISKFSSKNSRW